MPRQYNLTTPDYRRLNKLPYPSSPRRPLIQTFLSAVTRITYRLTIPFVTRDDGH
jgi:hypothetical protein